jgi:hypothetical protein
MASNRQNEANRSNAKRSTGPKTAGGKATSSRNAFRHGLASRCKRDDPELALLMVAVRSGLGAELGSDAAAAVAQARRDLWCVHMVRHAMLTDLSDCLVVQNVRRLKGLERYERSALAMQTRALRSLRSGEG